MTPFTCLTRRLFLVAWLLAACQPTPAPPPTHTPSSVVKIVIADTPSSLFYLPLQVAKTLNYFEAEGLKVELHYAPDGDIPANAAFAGGAFADAVSRKEWRMVVSFVRYPAVVVLARADLKDQVKSISDFRGSRIGVTAIGSHTHVIAAALADKAGLKRGDYTVVPVGVGALASAFDIRQVDGGLGFEPAALQLQKNNKAILLADLRTAADAEKYLGGEYQYAGLLAKAETVGHNPVIMQKVVNALVKAQRYVQVRAAEELAESLPDEVTGVDKQLWVEAFKATRPALSPDGRISRSGAENVVSALRSFGKISPGEQIDAERLYDNTFVEQVGQ